MLSHLVGFEASRPFDVAGYRRTEHGAVHGYLRAAQSELEADASGAHRAASGGQQYGNSGFPDGGDGVANDRPNQTAGIEEGAIEIDGEQPDRLPRGPQSS